jgi:DNA mismatch endonuclease (patch repair protein)
MMSRIGARNTKPELAVRRGLHAAGFRFRLHRGDLPGKPDIVLPRHRSVIFVHGCFWHRHEGCSNFRLPKTNTEFWREKIFRNAERDASAEEDLLRRDWRVLVVWECATRSLPMNDLVRQIAMWIEGSQNRGEVSRPPELK